MRLTRRGELVVTVLVALVAVAIILAIAFVPPGWWM